MTTAGASPPTPGARAPLSASQQASLSLFRFADSAHWTALLAILLPRQVLESGGDAYKGRALGLILASTALVSMLNAPICGTLSDRTHTRLGRRHPWIVVGTLLNIVGLMMLATIPTTSSALVHYTYAAIWIALFNSMATTPYAALIPDVVPAEQRGAASGWLGLMTMLGSFAGACIGLLLEIIGLAGAYYLIAAILLLGMLGTVLTIQEMPVPRTSLSVPRSSFIRNVLAPFRSRDFTWVFFTRFIMVMGTFTMLQFVQYYLQDVVRAPYHFFGKHLTSDPAAATSFFLLVLLVGAIVSSVAAGALSDRYGRKPLIYLSGSFQILSAIMFVFSGSFELTMVLGFVFGVGYGAYQSVDWAMATDVLPSLDDYARDMGIWQIAMTLPQMLAAPTGGFLLDRFQVIGQQHGVAHLGYTVIFALAGLYFMLGTALIRFIRGVH